jgi:hypothetical protein
LTVTGVQGSLRSWSRTEADHAIAAEQAVLETMSVNLLDLSQDETCRILDGAPLTGITARAWSQAAEALRSAWAHLDAFRQVVQRAVVLRGGRRRLGPDEIQKIRELLTGMSAELDSTEIPPALRIATGPMTIAQRASLDQLRVLIDAEYSQAAAVANAVAEVWRITDEQTRDLAAILSEVDDSARQDGAVDTVRTTLAGIVSAARTDPLSLHRGWPPTSGAEDEAGTEGSARVATGVDTTLFDALRRDLDRIRTQAAQELSIRAARAAKLLAEAGTLRGRLDGYLSRAQRFGCVEEPDIAGLYDHIRAELRKTPCDVEAVAAAIEEFRRRVENHRRSPGGGT